MPERDLFDIALRPAQGSRFQPTGFPDIGAALYERPAVVDGNDGWQQCLVVESAQSMANHLEGQGWDRGTQQPVPPLAGLPYVRVVASDGRFLTSSRTEAHRLASAFVKDADLDGRGMKVVIKERLGLRDDTPLAPRDIAAAVFALDPLCLIHGVFFAEKANVWPGQPKVQRATTAFVEAHDVKRAVSGGVKRDDVRHTVEATGGAAEGYGFIPFHRTEWVARHIVASFSIDLDQIASYGLPRSAADLLVAIARFEIRSLLDHGFRPRTACDLVPLDAAEVDAVLPSLETLTKEVTTLTQACRELVGDGKPLEVVWNGGPKKPS